MRRRTSSKASIPLSTSAGSSSPGITRNPSTSAFPPPVRPSHRPRTSSNASFSSSQMLASSSIPSGDSGPSASSIFPDVLRSTSQKGLEKVLNSRLVETFITITLPPSTNDKPPVARSNREDSGNPPSSPTPSRPTSPLRRTKDLAATKNGTTPKSTTRRGTIGAMTPPARLLCLPVTRPHRLSHPYL